MIVSLTERLYGVIGAQLINLQMKSNNFCVFWDTLTYTEAVWCDCVTYIEVVWCDCVTYIEVVWCDQSLGVKDCGTVYCSIL